MPEVNVYVDAEDVLDELSDEEILEYVNKRELFVTDPSFSNTSILETIYLLRRTGKDYQNELDQLIYEVLGRL